MDEPKVRRVGVRMRTKKPAQAHAAIGSVELFDVETGETIETGDVQINYPVGDVISVTVKIFVSAIEVLP